MKAVRLHAYGDPGALRLEEVPRPVPGPGEVLVRVEATGLNPVDLMLRSGAASQRMPLELPAVLGLDVAGTVEAVGEGVEGYAPGDRVIGMLGVNGRGGQAEYVAAKVKALAHRSAGVGAVAGAALPLVGLTGRQGVDALGIGAGARVLVTGALGAVGRAAVQYLRELGAVPVAGVRASRLEEARAVAGEAVALDGEVEAASVDAALDTVGGQEAATAARMVRDGGTLAGVRGLPDGAGGGGRIATRDVFGRQDPVMLQAIADAAARGDLMVPVARVLPLAEAAEGHRLLAAGGLGGKVILVP